MQYALGEGEERIEAAKGVAAVCPNCRERVVARLGKVVAPHWAHRARKDCDSWSKPETPWHRGWKGLFPREQVEVVMPPHRADVRVPSGRVVELQNASIDACMIEERERFYGDMAWVVNAAKFAERFFLTRTMGGGLFAFKWKHMAKSWLFAKRPVYLDFGQTTVGGLLGATVTTCGDHEDAVPHDQVVRYQGPSTPELTQYGYSAPKEYEALHPSVHSCSVLRVRTIHESGHGSAQPMGRLELMAALGGDPMRLIDMSAFAP